MRGLRRYRFVWLAIALAPWLLVIVLFVVGLSGYLENVFTYICRRFVPVCDLFNDSDVIVGFEVCHHLSLASPFLAWTVARRVARGSIRHANDGQWILSGVRPLWALSMCLGYAMVTIFFSALKAGLTYAGLFGLLILVMARLGFNIWWLAWCFRDADLISILERSKRKTGVHTFRLRDLDRVRKVSIQEYDDFTLELRISHRASVTAWKALGPIDDLAAILRDMEPGRAAGGRGHVLTSDGKASGV